MTRHLKNIRVSLAFKALVVYALTAGCAFADVVVIVNPANKTAIDVSAVARIYLAQVRSFPGGVAAHPVDQQDGAAIREEFTEKLLRKAPAHIKSYWAQQKFTGGLKALQKLSGDDAVLKFVAETPDAIGYIDASKVNASVKVALQL